MQCFVITRVALIVPACQPGWEEMENLRGNLKKFEEIWEEIIQNEVGLGGNPTIKVTLILQNMYLFTVDLQGRINWGYAAMT